MSRVSLEQQLFSWKDWQDEGPGLMGFSNVELKVPMGQFAVGTKFDFAWFYSDLSAVTLVDETNSQEYSFTLTLTPGPAVELPSTLGHADECACEHTDN